MNSLNLSFNSFIFAVSLILNNLHAYLFINSILSSYFESSFVNIIKTIGKFDNILSYVFNVFDLTPKVVFFLYKYWSIL